MTTKSKLLQLLEENKGSYLSGEEISQSLSLSRTAIWKAINSLRESGYIIDAVPNKGYCLSTESDILSEQGIRKYLNEECEGLSFTVLQTTTSTNTLLKEQAASGALEGTVIIANEQTGGRGRVGRKFFSPSGTGIYFSLLLRPENYSPAKSIEITTMAAVAVCMAIEEVSGLKPSIKWVNDVFLNGKKICGILTEGSLSLENGYLEYAVLGVGINVYYPSFLEFPEELRDIFGAIFEEKMPDGKNHLVAAFLNAFMHYYHNLNGSNYHEEYKKRCFVIGKEVTLLSNGVENGSAKVLDVDEECHLVVEYEDGTQGILSTGEISVRVK